jgi:methylglyoxal synthase
MNNRTTYFKDIKRIAILSFQDSRKDLIEWSYANKNVLSNHIIISTARTASVLEGTLNSPVLNLHHGRAGGYQQVKELLDQNKIDMILMFGNNPHSGAEGWFETLVRTAVDNDVVVGYNVATIEMLVKSLGNTQQAVGNEEKAMNN